LRLRPLALWVTLLSAALALRRPARSSASTARLDQRTRGAGPAWRQIGTRWPTALLPLSARPIDHVSPVWRVGPGIFGEDLVQSQPILRPRHRHRGQQALDISALAQRMVTVSSRVDDDPGIYFSRRRRRRRPRGATTCRPKSGRAAAKTQGSKTPNRQHAGRRSAWRRKLRRFEAGAAIGP